jgi:predicted DNA-binding transcriptional regulator YafY
MTATQSTTTITTTKPKLDALAILVLHYLQAHQGRRQGISAAALSAATHIPERTLRSAISLLREAGHAVVGTPETGYYMAANAQELRECCAFLRSRALHSLVIEARLMRLSLPQLLGQISLEMA